MAACADSMKLLPEMRKMTEILAKVHIKLDDAVLSELCISLPVNGLKVSDIQALWQRSSDPNMVVDGESLPQVAIMKYNEEQYKWLLELQPQCLYDSRHMDALIQTFPTRCMTITAQQLHNVQEYSKAMDSGLQFAKLALITDDLHMLHPDVLHALQTHIKEVEDNQTCWKGLYLGKCSERCDIPLCVKLQRLHIRMCEGVQLRSAQLPTASDPSCFAVGRKKAPMRFTGSEVGDISSERMGLRAPPRSLGITPILSDAQQPNFTRRISAIEPQRLHDVSGIVNLSQASSTTREGAQGSFLISAWGDKGSTVGSYGELSVSSEFIHPPTPIFESTRIVPARGNWSDVTSPLQGTIEVSMEIGPTPPAISASPMLTLMDRIDELISFLNVPQQITFSESQSAEISYTIAEYIKVTFLSVDATIKLISHLGEKYYYTHVQLKCLLYLSYTLNMTANILNNSKFFECMESIASIAQSRIAPKMCRRLRRSLVTFGHDRVDRHFTIWNINRISAGEETLDEVNKISGYLDFLKAVAKIDTDGDGPNVLCAYLELNCGCAICTYSVLRVAEDLPSRLTERVSHGLTFMHLFIIALNSQSHLLPMWNMLMAKLGTKVNWNKRDGVGLLPESYCRNSIRKKQMHMLRVQNS